MEAVKCDPEHKASRLEPSSNYSWNKLSPGSQQLRRSHVVREKSDYKAKAQKLDNLSGMLLHIFMFILYIPSNLPPPLSHAHACTRMHPK